MSSKQSETKKPLLDFSPRLVGEWIVYIPWFIFSCAFETLRWIVFELHHGLWRMTRVPENQVEWYNHETAFNAEGIFEKHFLLETTVSKNSSAWGDIFRRLSQTGAYMLMNSQKLPGPTTDTTWQMTGSARVHNIFATNSSNIPEVIRCVSIREYRVLKTALFACLCILCNVALCIRGIYCFAYCA